MEKDRFLWLGMSLVCHSVTLGRGPSRTRRVNLKGRRQRFDYIATAACVCRRPQTALLVETQFKILSGKH